jgi:hypothetical protein
MKAGWTLEDVEWKAFDPSKVEPDVLRAIKASAMVEFNAKDYVKYLCNVFHDDPAFQDVARKWGAEETQHGEVLGRWVKLADPDFDFEDAFRRFEDGYSLPLDQAESVRGSRAGELISRCIVESGTTSFYSAVRDSTEEPCLKQIAGLIAGDELRHYKLFYDHYHRISSLGEPWIGDRLRIALGRIREADSDDELGFAYYCANEDPSKVPYDQRRHGGAYELCAKRLYGPQHINRLVSMTAKAVGLRPQGRLVQGVSRMTCWLFRRRLRQLRALPA